MAAPRDTVDGVFSLLEQCAKLAGCTPARFVPYLAQHTDGVSYLCNMTPDQLRRAGDFARRKLADLQAKKGRKA